VLTCDLQNAHVAVRANLVSPECAASPHTHLAIPAWQRPCELLDVVLPKIVIETGQFRRHRGSGQCANPGTCTVNKQVMVYRMYWVDGLQF
jgi:hypothetical protein